MLKDHTEKEILFFLKKTQKEIGTDCKNLREMIKRKREKDRKQKVRNIFFWKKTQKLRRYVSKDTTFYILPSSTQICPKLVNPNLRRCVSRGTTLSI